VIVAEGTTNETPGPNLGVLVLTDLIEGYYNIEVTAPNHGMFKSDVEVIGGTIKTYKPFLPRQFVQYSWNVVPVDTVDQYSVTLDAVFETNVPAPVLTVNPMVLDLKTLNFDEQGKATVYYTVSNKGLIALNNVRINLGSGNGFVVSSEISNLGTLKANQSVVIPVEIQEGMIRSNDGECTLKQVAVAEYFCGQIVGQSVGFIMLTKGCPPADIVATDFGTNNYSFDYKVPVIRMLPTIGDFILCKPCEEMDGEAQVKLNKEPIEVFENDPASHGNFTFDPDFNWKLDGRLTRAHKANRVEWEIIRNGQVIDSGSGDSFKDWEFTKAGSDPTGEYIVKFYCRPLSSPDMRRLVSETKTFYLNNPVVHNCKVATHIDTSFKLTSGLVESIFRHGNKALQLRDEKRDFRAEVKLKLIGEIKEFGPGTGKYENLLATDDYQDYQEANLDPEYADFYFMEELLDREGGWLGDWLEYFGLSSPGVAVTFGKHPPCVMSRKANAITWTHEFGHSQGFNLGNNPPWHNHYIGGGNQNTIMFDAGGSQDGKVILSMDEANIFKKRRN
jgi:hypothetical protein